MSENGSAGNKDFLMLSRKFMENELWRERREFSKAEAWIDILFTVRYSREPEKVNIGYRKFLCHRGESLKSVETWAMRWGWSKSKVVRFFGMLKNRNAIETQNETVTTRLKVCNYEHYNKLRNDIGTQVERKPKRKRNANETQSETEEEGNKGIKKKEYNIYSADFLIFWDKYPNKKSKPRSFELYKKVTKTVSLDTLLKAIESQTTEKKHLRDTGQFCPDWPHPTTWLNQGRWEDEVTTVENAPTPRGMR